MSSVWLIFGLWLGKNACVLRKIFRPGQAAKINILLLTLQRYSKNRLKTSLCRKTSCCFLRTRISLFLIKRQKCRNVETSILVFCNLRKFDLAHTQPSRTLFIIYNIINIVIYLQPCFFFYRRFDVLTLLKSNTMRNMCFKDANFFWQFWFFRAKNTLRLSLNECLGYASRGALSNFLRFFCLKVFLFRKKTVTLQSTSF